VDSCGIDTHVLTHVNDGLLGHAALVAYQFDPQPGYLAFAQRVADYLMVTARRTADGTLCHIEDTVWDDTLISVVPFFLEMGQVSGDASYVDEAAEQMVKHSTHLQNGTTNLYHHAWHEEPDELLSPSYWARGNSWPMIASPLLIHNLPETHTLRTDIITSTHDHAQALAAVQDTSGLWRTVMNRPDFYLESAGSAGIAYGLECGIQQGWLAEEMATHVEAARLGLWEKVAADGTLTDVSASTPPLVPEELYNAIPHDVMQLFGQGMGLLILGGTCP
jgi:unsaturated rhamnogalacturonyl hydrolase